MTGFQACILGLVQGLTEFLPISSTAHLRIIPLLLGWEDPGAAFSAVIQLGTLLAALIYFRKDVIQLCLAAIQSLAQRNLFVSQDSRLAWSIAAGNVPIIVLGLSFKNFIEADARSLVLIGSSLIVLAIALFLAEKTSKKNRTTEELNFKAIQAIGLCQALALIPGCSRSGSTIMGGLLLGLTPREAARFSFLLGLPAIAGAGLFELKELLGYGLGEVSIFYILAGVGTAFISGYLTIGMLLEFLQKFGTLTFVIYRIFLGAAILIFFV